MQGDLSRSELIRQHCAAIQAGMTSVIFGLASLAEGIDLPGELCTHVIVPKLPFPVPDHPLEEARREWIERRGGSAFHEAMLPEAAIKLAQMVGRLVRTEDDIGQITILDPRIGTKAYGRQLLRGLPPMALEIFGRPVRLALPRGRGD
jgi:ATP-dependent DNA helicase DinG